MGKGVGIAGFSSALALALLFVNTASATGLTTDFLLLDKRMIIDSCVEIATDAIGRTGLRMTGHSSNAAFAEDNAGLYQIVCIVTNSDPFRMVVFFAAASTREYEDVKPTLNRLKTNFVQAEAPSAQAKSIEKGSDCAKVTSLANNGLKSIFGPNYSGSWVPAIINLAKGDSGVGNVFQNILRDNPGANNSIGQLVAAFLASSKGGYIEGVGGTTLNALLLGLALEQPQSGIDANMARALYGHYGFDAGNTALRNLQQAVIDALSDAAGQQSQQIRVMLQANLGASGKICTN
jgi:hypothetical protein